MRFQLDTAQLFVPDDLPGGEALARTTHMAIGAHQDDLEIMAAAGILACFGKAEQWFTGIVMTNGSRAPRQDSYTDTEMRAIRNREQKKAAILGEYAALALLDYPSRTVKDGSNQQPVADLVRLIEAARPEIIYTHNLADKHDTHIGVALKVIAAIRRLPPAERPRHLYGCEVWRDLDWAIDADKTLLSCSEREHLQTALIAVFDSQISGGKRYDLAAMGRRRAQATYHQPHQTDAESGLTLALELTPLIQDDDLDIGAYIQSFIDRFAADVQDRLKRLGSGTVPMGPHRI